MTNKEESLMSALAALLVLFSALLHPIVSVVLSIALLIGFSIYSYFRQKR